jgi:hypothetical protein
MCCILPLSERCGVVAVLAAVFVGRAELGKELTLNALNWLAAGS